MKTYRETLDALRFTPQQKAAIAEDLLAAAQAGQVRAPRRKWGRVAAAAILAAALCAACASGALQEALSVLASQFGSAPDQQEVIGDLTRPSAASATDNGVTISVDAVMGDGNSLVVLYRMERADGQPVLPQTEETASMSPWNSTLMFEANGLPELYALNDITFPEGVTPTGSVEFLDFTFSDTALYFYQFHTLHTQEEIPSTGTVTLTLKNLYTHEHLSVGNPSNEMDRTIIDRDIPLIDGSWTLTFSLERTYPVIELANGQTFHAETYQGYPLSGTLHELTLSPLSISLEYTYSTPSWVIDAISQEYYQDPELMENLPLDAWMRSELYYLQSAYCPRLTLKDGTQIPFDDFMNGSADASQDNLFRRTVIFDEVLPLDTVASITIGDLTIPLPDA